MRKRVITELHEQFLPTDKQQSYARLVSQAPYCDYPFLKGRASIKCLNFAIFLIICKYTLFFLKMRRLVHFDVFAPIKMQYSVRDKMSLCLWLISKEFLRL